MKESQKEIGWKDLEIGCIIREAGNARAYKTGDWRLQRPIWDKQRCIKCGICYIFCPEPSIRQDKDGFFEADLYYCKGCGICAHECPTGAIKMVEEG